MRVLHVCAGNLFGGIESMLLALAHYRFASDLMEQEFACCFSGRISGELSAAGAAIHILGDVRFSKPVSALRARSRFRKVLREHKFDCAVFHGPWTYALLASSTPMPCVFWAHGIHSGKHWLEVLSRLKRPAFVIANSEFTASAVPNIFKDAKRFVVYCPVAQPQPRACRQEMRSHLGLSGDSVAIFQVSRMEQWKGHSLLIEALASLRNDSNWECFMVGGAQRESEAEYESRLKQQIADSGLSGRIHLLGQRCDVPELLAAADIFCQPNLGPEPFGISFIEAMYAGLPVVTTALGAAPEIFRENCGILVKPNAGDLAAALAKLIADSETRSTLGTNAKIRAAALSDPAQQVKKFAEILFWNILNPQYPSKPQRIAAL